MGFLNNTDIVVGIGFLIFVGILLYFGVPRLMARRLDDRAVRIKAELDEARALREEAQTLLASYERRQKEVKTQAEEIVAAARHDAEQAAIRQIKDRAVSVAVAAAGDVIRDQIRADDANALIDAAIEEVGAKFH